MTQLLELPVTITVLTEGGFLADCPPIAGCHAEGKTAGQALDNLQDVARVIYELCQEHGLDFVAQSPAVQLDQIVWKIDLPLAKAA